MKIKAVILTSILSICCYGTGMSRRSNDTVPVVIARDTIKQMVHSGFIIGYLKGRKSIETTPLSADPNEVVTRLLIDWHEIEKTLYSDPNEE